MDTQLVVFVLSDEDYGVGISSVSEIIKLQPITFVPRAPDFVEGVTNLRGRVLPVIDLRKRFGLPLSVSTKNTRIVVVEIGGTMVGMVVDAVTEVLRVSSASIEPPSPVVTTVDSLFVTGIAKVGERLIILLDLEKVLLPEGKVDLQRTLQPVEQGEAASIGDESSPKATLVDAPEKQPAQEVEPEAPVEAEEPAETRVEE